MAQRNSYVRIGSEGYNNSLQFGKRGKGKRKLLLTVNRNMSIGSNITIEDDGTVVLNGKDRYTPEELWCDGRQLNGRVIVNELESGR